MKNRENNADEKLHDYFNSLEAFSILKAQWEGKRTKQNETSLQTNQVLNLRNRIREVEAKKESLLKQLGTPFLSQLSEEEQRLIDVLQVAYFEQQHSFICSQM